MSFFKKIFEFYISSSLHVAVEVCCFVGVTYLQFHIKADPVFLAFIFFGTVTGYNFIKYALIARLRHRSLTKNLRLIQIFSLGCFLALVHFSFKLRIETLLWVGFFGLFTIFYTVPIFPNKKNLRSLYGVKIFVIAFVVTGLTTIVPMVHHEINLTPTSGWIFAQRVAFIIAVIIPFEIRDMKSDISSLGTIPQQIGTKKAKLLGIGLLIIFLGMEFLKTGTSLAEIWAAVSITALSTGFIIFSSKEQSAFYASFWVEAIPIFWFLIFWSLANTLG